MSKRAKIHANAALQQNRHDMQILHIELNFQYYYFISIRYLDHREDLDRIFIRWSKLGLETNTPKCQISNCELEDFGSPSLPFLGVSSLDLGRSPRCIGPFFILPLPVLVVAVQYGLRGNCSWS